MFKFFKRKNSVPKNQSYHSNNLYCYDIKRFEDVDALKNKTPLENLGFITSIPMNEIPNHGDYIAISNPNENILLVVKYVIYNYITSNKYPGNHTGWSAICEVKLTKKKN